MAPIGKPKRRIVVEPLREVPHRRDPTPELPREKPERAPAEPRREKAPS